MWNALTDRHLLLCHLRDYDCRKQIRRLGFGDFLAEEDAITQIHVRMYFKKVLFS